MRVGSILRIVLTVFPLLLCSGASVYAQYYGYPANPPYPQVRRDSRAYPPGYYPGKLVQPAQPGFSLRRLFGVQEPPPLQPPPLTVRPRRLQPPRPAVVRHEKPKADPTTQVIVFGDALAEFAGQGLGELFADSEDVVVLRKAKENGGLIQMSGADWAKAIEEAVGTGKKTTTVAVVMLGSQDRQPLKQDAATYEPLTDQWREVYRGRVDAMMHAFNERNLPVVWIGLPPARNAKTSEDYLGMNEIYQESVRRNGGAYVDVWPGFVDEDNRYAMTGPDVDGQPAKLRTNDGAFFTKAGSRKIAHFADTEIKRLIESGQPAPPVVSVPPDAAAAPNSIEAALPALPDEVAPVSLPTKPLIGPVLPLNQAVVAPGGTLVTSAPKLSSDQSYLARRALREGIAPAPHPGRADDFRWPPF
jgi:hypothetical protein